MMKKMVSKKMRFVGFMLCFAMLLTGVFSFSVPVSAAGTETLPYGQYNMGGFTFTDTNLSPVKTVPGRYLNLGISFKKASDDKGVGNVKLTIKVKDTNTGATIYTSDPWDASKDGGYCMLVTRQIDLGYNNRRIQIWYDASSTGASNGNFRRIEISKAQSIVQ